MVIYGLNFSFKMQFLTVSRRKSQEFFPKAPFYLSEYVAEAAIEQYKNQGKMHQRFALCFFVKNQTKRSTDDELGLIVQHKLNQVFEYSNNHGENFKQLCPASHIAEKTKLHPLQWVAKRFSFRKNLNLEHSQVSAILGDYVLSFYVSKRIGMVSI